MNESVGQATFLNVPETKDQDSGEMCPDALGQHRADIRRLYRRYQSLSRSTSALDQRERSALQVPLMALYRTLHPEMICVHFEDDFDAIMRAERRAER